MAKSPRNTLPGFPSKKQVLEFIQTTSGPAGKREIARAFGLKGQEKIALKKLLRDMAEEGLIDGGKTAYHRMGGVPKVTVLRVVEIEDGEAIAIPDSWHADSGTPPPRLRLIEGKKGKTRQAALKKGDRVLARTEEVGKGWNAFPIKKLPASSETQMGVVELEKTGKAWLAPVDKRVRNSLPISDLGGAEEGQLVLAEPTSRSPRAAMKVVEILGDPLAPRAFSLIAISKHGIPHIFPDDVQAEARSASTLPLTTDKREDLRALPIVAIDPSDARDHDDAIWAEADGAGGFKAIIAIADVSYYVRPGGVLDKEARKRGNSVYFPDRVVPMLPHSLSSDMCSLRQGETRAALACHLHISADGKILEQQFRRALVKIHEVIAYEDAQARIDEGTAEPYLTALWDCWAVLAKAREKREPLDLDLPERRVVLDDNGKIASIAVRERLDAHRVVEDFMIAANVAAAKALENKAAPVVYRVHEPPSREKLIALKEYLASLDKNLALGQVITPSTFNRFLSSIEDEGEKAQMMEAVLRSQTQAYYSPKNAGHFGLALGSYGHFTSPIRRYADLLLHRALVDAFGLEQAAPHEDLPPSTGLSDNDKAKLDKICDAISQAERRAMEAERETIDRYVAAWLASKVGEVFDTRITGVQSFGFFATIEGLGGDGLVPVSTLGAEHFAYNEKAQSLYGEQSGKTYRPGDRLKLKLGEANPLTGALKFVTLDNEDGAIEHRGRREGQKPKFNAKYMTGKRGRPRNIRHQGRKR